VGIVGDITQTGNIDLTGDFTTSGTVEVTGNITATGTLEVGDISIAGHTIQVTTSGTDLDLRTTGIANIIFEDFNLPQDEKNTIYAYLEEGFDYKLHSEAGICMAVLH
jgi:hypothetical protein